LRSSLLAMARGQIVKYLTKRLRKHSQILALVWWKIPLVHDPKHGVRLSCASLSITNNGGVVSLEIPLDNLLTGIVVDHLLSCGRREDVTVAEMTRAVRIFN
jgi:hypothetical protein